MATKNTEFTETTTIWEQTQGIGTIDDYLSWLFVRTQDSQSFTTFSAAQSKPMNPLTRLFRELRNQIYGSVDLPYRINLKPKRMNIKLCQYLVTYIICPPYNMGHMILSTLKWTLKNLFSVQKLLEKVEHYKIFWDNAEKNCRLEKRPLPSEPDDGSFTGFDYSFPV